MELTQEYVRQLFDYRDGELYWKQSKGGSKTGDIAGSPNIHRGRFRICVDRKEYYRSRLVWLWHHGQPIPHSIDHRDRNKLNDRIENLRSATGSQQNANVGTIASNTSGIKGVRWNTQKKKWQARVQHQGKQFHLGWFHTIEEATEARRKAFESRFEEFAHHASSNKDAS